MIIHEAEEGGYWAEVPAIQGCATQGDTFEELISNLYEAVEACLSIDLVEVVISGKDKVLELAVWNPFREKLLRGYLSAKDGNLSELVVAIIFIW